MTGTTKLTVEQWLEVERLWKSMSDSSQNATERVVLTPGTLLEGTGGVGYVRVEFGCGWGTFTNDVFTDGTSSRVGI